MGTKVVNVNSMAADHSSSSFSTLLEKADDNVRRDSYTYFQFTDVPSESIQAGYVLVYPGCRCKGHTHEDLEEIYHITRGSGRMIVGEEEFPVSTGDTFCVPPKNFHALINTSQGPLESFWVVSRVQR